MALTYFKMQIHKIYAFGINFLYSSMLKRFIVLWLLLLGNVNITA